MPANPNYGTLNLLDTLAAIDQANVMEYGEDKLYQHISDLLVMHNKHTREMIDLFVERTTEKVARYGNQAVGGEMVEVDEWGRVDVQKTAVTGHDIGWPLRSYQYGIGWTKKYFEIKAVADIAKEFVNAQTADVRNLRRQILTGLFRPTNNTSYIDRLDNQVTLPLRALINADGTTLPMNEYGTTFDGATHTHYLARAGGSLVAADITALVDTVVEHGVNGGQVLLYINKAQEAAISAMALFDAFQKPLIDPGPGSTADVAAGGRKLNPYNMDDRPIGVWDGYVIVWTKPWIPANYQVAFITGGANAKVLRMRRRPVAGYGEYRLVGEHDHFPLRAQHFEREFGVSAWNRTGAAILYSNGTSYVEPVIA